MRYLLLLPLTSLLTLIACNSDKDRKSEIVEEWLGKEIEFPSDLIFTIDNDTIEYEIDDCDYKIFHYVDSGGCTGCKLTLPAWEQLMGEVMTNQEIDVKLLMVVNTSNPIELRKNIKRYRFKYPISYTTENMLSYVIDKSWDNQHSHTFLLNDNNEIVLTGNPVLNEDVRDLYRKKLKIRHKDKKSTIRVTPENLAMGIFQPMEEKKSKFRLFNSGDKIIIIRDIYTSCECTSAWTDNDTVFPNSEIDIHVTCKANKNENEFIRYIYVSLNNNENLHLPLCGFVAKKGS